MKKKKKNGEWKTISPGDLVSLVEPVSAYLRPTYMYMGESISSRRTTARELAKTVVRVDHPTSMIVVSVISRTYADGSLPTELRHHAFVIESLTGRSGWIDTHRLARVSEDRRDG